MQIDLIANLCARRYGRDPRLLARVRRAAGASCTLHLTRHVDELAAVCAELARRGTDLVVLSGGDGTLMAGVTALLAAFGPEHLPRLAPIPGGTVGTVARNWGTRGDPVACLRWVLHHATESRPKRTLCVTEVGADGEAAATRHGFIFGTGLVAQFFELYYERGAPGSLASALVVAQIFVESFVGGALARRVLDPLPLELRLAGKPLAPPAWSLVCASVVPDVGIHMLVNYRANEDPERIHLVASCLPAGELGRRAPLPFAGLAIGGKGHVDELVPGFTVAFPTTGPYVLDGELLHAPRVEVKLGPVVPMVTPR